MDASSNERSDNYLRLIWENFAHEIEIVSEDDERLAVFHPRSYNVHRVRLT